MTALVCYFMIPIVFGIEFAGSVPAVWVLLAAAATALPVFFGYSAVAQAKSATMILMIASICAAVGNVVFNFVLIPRFGLIGCAWATVATCFIGTLVYSVLLKRRFDISLSWVFPAIAASGCGRGDLYADGKRRLAAVGLHRLGRSYSVFSAVIAS